MKLVYRLYRKSRHVGKQYANREIVFDEPMPAKPTLVHRKAAIDRTRLQLPESPAPEGSYYILYSCEHIKLHCYRCGEVIRNSDKFPFNHDHDCNGRRPTKRQIEKFHRDVGRLVNQPSV